MVTPLWGTINAKFGYYEIANESVINATTDRAIGKILETAIAEGLSIEDLTALAERQYASWLSGRAGFIAVTETTGAFGAGSLNAVKQERLAEYKVWETVGDDRVREWHEDAEGQTVPVNEPFDVGGEELDEPGDPNGSPDNIDNCRCWADYTDEPED